MKSAGTIHVLPIDGQWAVMTDDRECIERNLATREEAIKVAGQSAADGQFAFLMIHSKDDLRPRKGPAAA
jgi:hypothetical protein